MVLELSIVLAFMGGLFTVTTPCILPILPAVLTGSVGHRLRPMLIVLGQAISFTLMGGLFSTIGIVTGELLRSLFGFFIICFGFVMASERINEFYIIYSSRLTNLFGLFQKKVVSIYGKEIPRRNSLLGAFILGLSLGIVWIPCIGPILGSILSYTSYEGNLLYGSTLLFSYSMGIALPLLIIAYGNKYVSGKLNFVTHNYKIIKKIGGLMLIVIGISLLLQLDQYVLHPLLPYFPDLESKLFT